MEQETQQIQKSIVDTVAEKYEDPIDREFVRAAMRLYMPGSWAHPVEWKPETDNLGRPFLGVSSLVKKTAHGYAKRIIEQREDMDETEGFYAKQGNTLAQDHFNSLTPFQENQARIPNFTPKRDLVGHLDAIYVYDYDTGENLSFKDPETWPDTVALRVCEHKHQDPNEDDGGGNVDLAERQVFLGASALAFWLNVLRNEALVRGDSHYGLVVPPAFTSPSAHPLRMPTRIMATVQRVSVHFWARTGPDPIVIPHKISSEDFGKTLEIYHQKAMAIEDAIEAKDLKPAIAFSHSVFGIQEFKRTMSAVEAGLVNERLLKSALIYKRGLAMEKLADAAKKEHGAIVSSLMKQTTEKSVNCEASDGTKVRVTLTQKADGSSYPTITVKDEWDIARFDEEIRKAA